MILTISSEGLELPLTHMLRLSNSTRSSVMHLLLKKRLHWLRQRDFAGKMIISSKRLREEVVTERQLWM